MPRLAICSRDLHWHWINRTLLCDTMEVSMLSRAWLTIAQHVFQPALTGRPELISRKIFSRELGPRFYRDFAKNIALLGAKKWGPTCDRNISNSTIYMTAIYRAYTVLAQINYELSHGQAEFPRILSKNGQNDLEGHGQWPPFSIPAESIPGCMFGANLVILAQIYDKLSCVQA